MHIEIDQSGKIGDTQIATVLAFSNHKSYSIYISSVVKRKLVQKLRTTENSRVFYFQLFSLLIFLLIKDFIEEIRMICIDQEYQGREDQIKVYLINFCKKNRVTLDPDIIHFSNIGKESPAHNIAIESLRSKNTNCKITFEEIASHFLPTKKDRGSYR